MREIDGGMVVDIGDLRGHFSGGGSVYFLIEKKNAKIFKKQTDRIKRMGRLLKGGTPVVLSGISYHLYALYVGIIGRWIGFRQNELERPLLIYVTCWKCIASIDGVDLPDGKAKMIFYGRLM